jgi:septal ring factor EnvC (AmiA/AmiB activator)
VIPDLWGVVAPVVASVLVLLVGGFLVRRYAGPAQAASAAAQASYVASVEGRLRVLESERDDATRHRAELEAEVKALRREVDRLERQVMELLNENHDLRAAAGRAEDRS